MLMEFPNFVPLRVSLRGIFLLYASKDGSGASLADLLDLAVLLIEWSKSVKGGDSNDIISL